MPTPTSSSARSRRRAERVRTRALRHRPPGGDGRTETERETGNRPTRPCATRLLVDARRSDEFEPEAINLDTRFTRQDNIEQTWRIVKPLLDKPPKGAAVQAGVVGPEGGRQAGRQVRRLARPLGTVMSAEKTTKAAKGKRTSSGDGKRAAGAEAGVQTPLPPRPSRRLPTTPSFPTATQAPSSRPMGRSPGCACRASTRRASSGPCWTARPAAFGSGRLDINVPTTRAYQPGTNVLVTTWNTPSGWVIVRDALTMGPRRGEDTITPHTRPPADQDADHVLVRTARCLEGSVEMELICEPAFDYGRTPAEWSLVDEDRPASRTRPAGTRR